MTALASAAQNILSEFASENPAPWGWGEGGEQCCEIGEADSFPTNPAPMPHPKGRGRGSLPRIRSSGAGEFLARARARFLALNRRGAISIVLGAIMAVGVALYIGALIFSFQLGVEVRAAHSRAAEEEERVTQLEIGLHREEAEFPRRHADVLAGMEKISSIKYLAPENVALR